MISTLFLIFLLAFEICYVTSEQYKPSKPRLYLQKLRANKQNAHLGAAVLLLLATTGFVIIFGWASGLFGAVISLMAAGSLIVVLQPFAYLKPGNIILIYGCVFLLEIFI
ncbi:hypothetical protein ACJVDH_15525 [Pedobacter sp. AW1-32]|uniref:hypothetical protein n=1 Tax=Pedobacter sp. AW1-32 TaxID=3383026 RepID=UPI003FF05073